MEERLSPYRPSGLNRNSLRLIGLVIAALGILGRGILQNRVLGQASGTDLSQLLEASPEAMNAATAAIVLWAIEGAAVPIFAVLTVSGFSHTSSVKNYLLRLLLLALVSQVPYHLALTGVPFRLFPLNPVFGLALVVASPIMLFSAIAIRCCDGGPVFYRQCRLTEDGRTFDILKFRSMRVNAEEDGVARLAAEHDDRITPVGKVLRKYRLDELPQFINILKGEMSVVGPRPERKCLADEITRELPEFPYRLKVRGGLTGYAQIFGKYNTSAYDKLRLDLMYIENYSLLLDIKLIVLTLRIIFSKDSTEGIDKAREIQEKSRELLEELQYPNK